MTTFTVEEVFQLVGTSVGPYFHRRQVELVDDDKKTTTMSLTDFVIKCLAEEMAEKWAPEEEVKAVLEKNHGDVTLSEAGLGLRSISGGSHRSKTRRRTSKTIRMKKSAYLREHHHLFRVLQNPTRRALNAELRDQKRELARRGLKE